MLITGMYAGILSFLIVALALNVSRHRLKLRIGLLDGDNEQLRRIIRVHANAAEWLPLAIILLALAESNGCQVWLLHLVGIMLIISRCLHAYGLSQSSNKSFGRFWGTLGTWVVILLLAGFNLWTGVVSLFVS